MVNAIILPNFVLRDLVFEGSNFNLRLYGCVDTPLETNPMDKKKAISEFHFAHTQNKCNCFNLHLFSNLVYNCTQFDLDKRATDEYDF